MPRAQVVLRKIPSPFFVFAHFKNISLFTRDYRYAAKLEAEKERYHAMAHPSEDHCDADKENADANDDGDSPEAIGKHQHGSESSDQSQPAFYDQSDRNILSQVAGVDASPHVQALAALENDLAEATRAVVASASTNMEDLD